MERKNWSGWKDCNIVFEDKKHSCLADALIGEVIFYGCQRLSYSIRLFLLACVFISGCCVCMHVCCIPVVG